MLRLHPVRSACFGAAAAVLVGLGTASAAAAPAAARPAHATHSAHGAQHVVFGRADKFALSNWAGYIALGTKGKFTSISGSWTIASVTCLKNADLYAPWVGLDGDGSSTVEQTGVQTSCSTGSPVSSAWYEMYPANPVYFSNPVSTGDVIDASVTASGDSFTLTISDTTQGWTKTVTKTLATAKLKSAEAVIEAPGGFPSIKSINFTDVLINGKDLSTFAPTKSGSAGANGVTYHPGPITDGTNFSILPKG